MPIVGLQRKAGLTGIMDSNALRTVPDIFTSVKPNDKQRKDETTTFHVWDSPS